MEFERQVGLSLSACQLNRVQAGAIMEFKRIINYQRQLIKGSLNKFGFEISRRRTPERQLFEALCLLKVRESSSDTIPFLEYCARNMGLAHAGMFQDLLVLFLLEEKRDGYFVEFGAADGIQASNTFLLEYKFGWHGIVAEPARCWHQKLTRNRTCSIDQRCVWSKSGETLQFNETASAELSTIDALSGLDRYAWARQDGKRYAVETISLCDLLRAHDAPRSIDYLSIDTEGSEFAILDSFFPGRYEIRIITVEHNYTDQQSRIHSLLTSSGYKQVFKELYGRQLVH
jgi:FkbM family methyltransferase